MVRDCSVASREESDDDDRDGGCTRLHRLLEMVSRNAVSQWWCDAAPLAERKQSDADDK